jgi:hypothetical protein
VRRSVGSGEGRRRRRVLTCGDAVFATRLQKGREVEAVAAARSPCLAMLFVASLASDA